MKSNIIHKSIIIDMKTDEKTLVNWMKLTRVNGLGPKKITSLFFAFKSLNNILAASRDELLACGLFNEKMLDSWEHVKGASDENFIKVIESCKQNNIKIMTMFDEAYPACLRDIPSSPLTLFLWGNTNLLSSAKIGIVGSREAEKSALDIAYSSAKHLAERGFTIVSGGANGIDTMAHKGALDAGGKTISVLGAGFFNLYPKENIQLFEEIKKEGLLISEHLPNFSGSAISYIQRNRITSGLSSALLVCATNKLTGGTSTQVQTAYKQGIPIFCPASELAGNPGLAELVKKYGIKQIQNSGEIIDFLKNKCEAGQTKQIQLALDMAAT